jgi:hypothetical protein
MAPLPGRACAGTCRITVDKVSTDYFLREVPADFGHGFELSKLGPGSDPEVETYHVLLAPNGQHSCECKGFLRWGLGRDGKGCKHIGALLTLLGPPQAPAAAPTSPSAS